MKRIFSLVIILSTLLPAADAPLALPPFAKWSVYQRKGAIGKVEILPTTADAPLGKARFLPVEGDHTRYAVTLYGLVHPAKNGRYRLAASWRSSKEMTAPAKLVLYFQARDRSGKWVNAVTKNPVPVRKNIPPGASGEIECRIDLGAIPEASDLAWLAPTIVVQQLKGGALEITSVRLEPWTSEKQEPKPATAMAVATPAPSAGLAGFRALPKLPHYQWPHELKGFKFRTLINHTPLGVNELTLNPGHRAAGFQWPDGHTVLARFQDGKWRLEEGDLPGKLVPAGELDGETLRLAEFGTGVRAAVGQRQITLERLRPGTGATLLLAEGAPEPPVFSMELLPDLLHWLYLEEAAVALENTKRLLARNRQMLARNTYYAARRWQMRIAHTEKMLRQSQEQIAAASRGLVPAIAALPRARDRYHYLMAFAAPRFYETNDSYLGPVFHKLWFSKMQGAPEVADALELARQAEALFRRCFYDQRHAFQLGKVSGSNLAAAWCDNLTQVPKRACGPENLAADGELSLARGESEGIQLVLTAGAAPVANCSVELKPALPAGLSVKFHLVDYIRSMPPSVPMLPLSTRGGLVPDVLKTIPPRQRFHVAPETNQSLWMTFTADDGAAPGTYDLTAVVTGADNLRLELPLKVTVQPFRLGANRLACMAGLRCSVLRRWFCDNQATDPRFPKVRRNFIATYLEYKMNPLDLYVPSPALEDLPFALQHGLREVNVARAFDDFADPAPAVPRFVRIFGSQDGRAYQPVKATARLAKRGDGLLDDTDLIVVPDASEPSFPFYKVHYAETRDWHGSESGAIRLYPAEGGSIELLDAKDAAIAPAGLQFLHNDRKPEQSEGFRKAPLPATSVFDQLRTRSPVETHASIVIAVPDGRRPASIRLVNRQVEKAARQLKETYEKYHAIAGDKVTYYIYGYDESPAHLHPKVRTAAERLRKAFPQLRSVTTIARIADPEIYRYLSIHCPGNGSSMPLLDAEQHRLTGTDFWIYVGGGTYFPFATFERVDQPLIQSRAFFFPIITHPHITGWLHWATNLWDLNRRHDYDWSRWDTSHGENSGMKAIFYPGPNLQCFPSLRAEAIRDGIEDVNYARLAEELIRQRRFPNDQARADAARELADIQGKFSLGISQTCRDPEQLKALRKRLTALLNRLWMLEEGK
jgi:hypothetical protein